MCVKLNHCVTISIKIHSHPHLRSLHPSIPFLGQQPVQQRHILLVRWRVLIALIKKLISPWRKILLISLYSSWRQALKHLPFLFSSTDWAGRLDPVWPGRLHRDKIESFNRQTDHPGAPHIHHAAEISEGGSNVQVDSSDNTLKMRKLEHGVH